MDMYLDTYANWYPQNHQLGTYPRRNGARQYTEAERTALYKALTPAQQNGSLFSAMLTPITCAVSRPSITVSVIGR